MTDSDSATPPSPGEAADRIAAAAVTLAGHKGWRGLTLAEIAAEAGVTLPELSRRYRCKPEILDGFERMIDTQMLSGTAADTGDEKPRDRLFDVVMARFDALSPFRDGVRRIARELPFDSASGLVLAMAMPRTAAWMLASAGIKTSGPFMPFRLAATSGLYLSVFRVWLNDQSEDLAKTMAALDRALDKAGAVFGTDFARSPLSDIPPESADVVAGGTVKA